MLYRSVSIDNSWLIWWSRFMSGFRVLMREAMSVAVRSVPPVW
uniref:Uncharacterized protein n=1 Tax=Cutibacterium phage vB_CacS-HV1 TaxID=3236917 RepID=A0AB39CFE6_9CAUD